MSNLRAEVRKHLQAIRSNLAKVEGIAPLNRIEQGEYASEQQEDLEKLLRQLHQDLTAIKRIVRTKAGSGAPVLYGLNAEESKYLMDELEPRSELLENTYHRVVHPLFYDLLKGAKPFSPEESRIRETIEWSLEKWEEKLEELIDHEFWDQDDAEQRFDFNGAREVVEWPRFLPDLWFQNMHELRAVILTIDGFLPKALAARLIEAYQAFISGHYYATVALARSVLEYGVWDRVRANALPIDTRNPNQITENADLETLIDRACAALGVIDSSRWHFIRKWGNAVMHAEKTDVMSKAPKNREIALKCVEYLRDALTHLYMPSTK